MSDSAEKIAAVVADLRSGKAASASGDKALFRFALDRMRKTQTVVDATPIYQSLADNPQPVYVYEDHPSIAPPWESAAICYVNEHGNVIVMEFTAKEFSGKPGDQHREWHRDWEPAEPVEWEKVRWTEQIFIWVGGKSKNNAVPTHGPRHAWTHAVYENGEPADLHWIHLIPDYPMGNWDMAQLVLLGALNYCNCRNVELVEPQRPRPEARRIARTGVRVSTINVFPVGRSSTERSNKTGAGTPLTSVRGHFSTYGPEYGKGLLFGKYSGRFWVPQHARGDKAIGEVQHDYALRADA